MKYAISTTTGTHFTMTIAPFYVGNGPRIDYAKCIEHVKSFVGPHAIIVEIKDERH